MLISSAAVNSDDPDDEGFKSVWVLEGGGHGTNHSVDLKLRAL